MPIQLLILEFFRQEKEYLQDNQRMNMMMALLKKMDQNFCKLIK
jgi:deoxyribodipyrimidine photolyase-like uncharacterized protein